MSAAALRAWVAALLLPLAAAAQPVITAAQQAWLNEHGTLRAAPERDYGPFVYVEDDGRVAGLSVEMLQLVQKRSGVELRWLPPQPLSQQLERARRREADLLTSLRPNPERSAFLLFTRPYVKVPALLVVREGQAGKTLASLQGRPVAVGAGYAVEPFVRSSYPGVAWLAVSDDLQALRSVLDGRADAAVVDAASAAFVARRHSLAGLASAGEVGFDYELSFAVRSDWPELRAILDAGIVAVPEPERAAVLRRWLEPLQSDEMAARAPLATRLGVLLVFFAVLVGIVLYARRVRVKPARPRPRGRPPQP
ncbi:ABC-type amino acid transport substrate-binding protein [Rubrivivax gelatinosus]|uniref:transporter substrate-binding domain-containing protein n=2 Tax=Rubrivivax gelatinosus TaxID=28068 RepID=UPI001A26E6A6|nr:transporter substrate-binding domain-containing protein [Rubrivivax gelatinosus]MBG6078942.1 ABC-type amino acid transport substrate-binding protein [Rubrivivax gelatinosus]